MSQQKIMRITIGAFAALLAIATAGQTAVAQKADVSLVANPQTQTAIADEHIKQILLLMSTNQNGRISEREFMKFMRSEFRKLDTSLSGQVNTQEPAHSKPQVIPSLLYGK